jgi:hypothetical protein
VYCGSAGGNGDIVADDEFITQADIKKKTDLKQERT